MLLLLLGRGWGLVVRKPGVHDHPRETVFVGEKTLVWEARELGLGREPG